MHSLRVLIKKNDSNLDIVSTDEVFHHIFLKNTSKEMLQSKIGRRFYPEIVMMCLISTIGLIYCQEFNLNLDQTLTQKNCLKDNEGDSNTILLRPIMIALVVYHIFQYLFNRFVYKYINSLRY